MFLDISNPAINDHSVRPEILGARGHEPSPAGGIQSLGLLDIHDLAGFIAVRKVPGGFGRVAVAHLDHLHGDGGTDDFGCSAPRLGRPHRDPVKKPTEGITEFDQRIANLEGGDGRISYDLTLEGKRRMGERADAFATYITAGKRAKALQESCRRHCSGSWHR